MLKKIAIFLKKSSSIQYKYQFFQKLISVENGLLLCPNHDKLVDNGLISFDDTGKILISNKLSETDRIFMNIKDDMKIKITDNNAPYILYHRLNVFRK